MFGIKKKSSDNKKTFNKTKISWNQKLGNFFSRSEIDDVFWDDFEEILITSDVGMKTSFNVIEKIREITIAKKIKTISEIKPIMRQVLFDMFSTDEILYENIDQEQTILLVVGVNGAGKTTSIAKIANSFSKNNKKVMLAAADTFRAGAIDQLQIWADRANVELIKQKMGSDPASVAHDTMESGLRKKSDIIIIDTAGRLHNKINLMNELTKVKKVMNNVISNAPNEVILVLDGSTGQNAFEQAKQFTQATEVNSLVVTKLDGTAKGGVVLGISDQFQIPVKFIGVGESIEDLQVFDPKLFVDSFFKKNN